MSMQLSGLQARGSVHGIVSAIADDRTDHSPSLTALYVTAIHLANSQRILAEGEPDAALDAAAENDTLQKLETVDGVVDVLKLHKAHGSI